MAEQFSKQYTTITLVILNSYQSVQYGFTYTSEGASIGPLGPPRTLHVELEGILFCEVPCVSIFACQISTHRKEEMRPLTVCDF